MHNIVSKKMKIFLLPYAGGSSFVYNLWKDADIEYIPVEYRGHGRRIGEKLCNSITEIAEEIFSFLEQNVEDDEYSILGHSMGGLVAYELYKVIEMNGYKKPVSIYISGCRAPNCEVREKISNLKGEDYKRAIIYLGMTTEYFFTNEELFYTFNPILLKDFQINEVYKNNKDIMITSNLVICNGEKDLTVNEYEIKEWEKFSCRKCDFYSFEGDHFYLNNHEQLKKLMNIIKNDCVLYSNSKLVKLNDSEE